MAGRFHLAQVNIATARAALDDPLMAGFNARLEPLNALADAAPGFVWRLQSEAADALAARLFDNPRLLFNLTLWESVEALEAYVYGSNHVEAVRKRRDWFERPEGAALALWWIEAGSLPGVEDAKWRLEKIWSDGPTDEAFNFRHRFPAPSGDDLPHGKEQTR